MLLIDPSLLAVTSVDSDPDSHHILEQIPLTTLVKKRCRRITSVDSDSSTLRIKFRFEKYLATVSGRVCNEESIELSCKSHDSCPWYTTYCIAHTDILPGQVLVLIEGSLKYWRDESYILHHFLLLNPWTIYWILDNIELNHCLPFFLS
jgi:hypothetical protein